MSRKWMLTINNFTINEENDLLKYINNKKTWIFGKHFSGENKVPHIHCWINHKTAITQKTLKNKFPRAHLDIGKGTDEQAYNYINKEANGTVQTNYKKPESLSTAISNFLGFCEIKKHNQVRDAYEKLLKIADKNKCRKENIISHLVNNENVIDMLSCEYCSKKIKTNILDTIPSAPCLSQGNTA